MMEKKSILYISSTNYKRVSAGTEKFMGDLIEQYRKDEIHSIHIFPLANINSKLNRLCLKLFYFGVNFDGNFIGVYLVKDLIKAIGYVCKTNLVGIDRVIVNQLHDWNLVSLSDFLLELNLPIIIVVHDYMMACPYMMLNDSKSKECGKFIEPLSDTHCLDCKYTELGMKHSSNMYDFLLQTNRLISKIVFPSDSAKTNWLRVYPDFSSRAVTRPHLKYKVLKKTTNWNKRIRIGYLGFISDIKGYSEWLELKNNLNDDRFEFYYFGSAINKAERDGAKGVLVDFNIPESPGMVEQLEMNDIDIAFLWSNCQETYSYTYYEAFEAGCWVITSSHSGNITDQVMINKNGIVFNNIDECILYLRQLSGEIELSQIMDVDTNKSMIEFTPEHRNDHSIVVKKIKRPQQLLTFLYKWLRSS